MKITITSGVGNGPTELAAFDAALHDAGISNFNLIKMSSILPRFTQVAEFKYTAQDLAWGNKLYVVLSEARESDVGEEAWAGLGYVQRLDDQRGLLVEHHGSSKQFVEEQIQKTLAHMLSYRDGIWSEPKLIVSGITCETTPVCALVAAVYKSESWTR